MKQLLQDVSSGEVRVLDVPAPARDPAAYLVSTSFSLISAGTERALVDLGRKSLIGKARARPDLARKVVDSAREEGLRTAYQKVRGRLDHPNPLGYSSCGRVVEAPAGASARPGDLVACAGAGYANHAELVSVPRNLCAPVPEGVDPADAAYATVAAIALHGLRLCEPEIGDVVAVVGLGLVGQLALELVAAAGCVALGFDPDANRAQLAREGGLWATTEPAELNAEALRATSGRGADAALVTAASSDPGPLANAVDAVREQGVVSVVGDVPVSSPRGPLFAKELRLVVSRSYGPGRYDPVYEEKGIDYPAGYVRWTEGRNLGEVLRLMAAGRLRPGRLTTHTFDIAEAADAYALLDADEPALGILLRYPEQPPPVERTLRTPRRYRRVARRAAERPRVGVLGAGMFARTVLLPALARHADVSAVVTATGASARATAARFGAQTASTDPAAVFDDDSLDAVLIATRHDTHAPYVVRALEAGKHVFVEKPPAIDLSGLEAIERALERTGATLTVGFNRRHAPLGRRLHAMFGSQPILLQYRINAGPLPRNHWVHDPDVGGGRVVAEACHFVDFATFMCGGSTAGIQAAAVAGSVQPLFDTFTATLSFPAGSVAVVTYASLGDPGLAKERVEILADSGAAVLDDFRELTTHIGGRRQVLGGTRDKGHSAEMAAWAQTCRTAEPMQDPYEALAAMRTTFAVRDALATLQHEPAAPE